MRTCSQNLNWPRKPFSALEVIYKVRYSEPKNTKIGPNTLPTLFHLQRRKLLEEVGTTTSTYEKGTEFD